MPEPIHRVHGPVIEELSARRYILQIPFPYWSMPPFSNDEVDHFLAEQKAREYLIVDALPHFEDELRDARSRVPALRDALAHLEGLPGS